MINLMIDIKKNFKKKKQTRETGLEGRMGRKRFFR